MRRVVVTGMGLVTPLGCGVRLNWERLVAGKSGISRVESFDVSDLNSRVAGQIPRGVGGDGTFNLEDWGTARDRRRMGDFIVYALAAAHEAVLDAGWMPEDEESRIQTGVIIGSGIGGLQGITDGAMVLNEKGPRRVTPFYIPASLINLASGNVSIRYQFKGPNHSVVTACSSGSHAIGDAARLIMFEDADVMVAGGAEAAVCRMGLAGFDAAKALSTHFNDEPERASRPWDQDRDGFVVGEGAGIVVLEELEHAKRRGANIHAESSAMACRATPITSPPRPRTAPAPTAPCGTRSSAPGSNSTRSTILTHMGRPRSWATKSS